MIKHFFFYLKIRRFYEPKRNNLLKRKKVFECAGLSYSELNKLSNGKISSYYLKALRQNNADLPLSTLEQIAKVLNVDIYMLLDPNLEYRRTDCVFAHQFKTRMLLLNEEQYSKVKSWEEQNRKRINEARYYQYFKLQNLKH